MYFLKFLGAINKELYSISLIDFQWPACLDHQAVRMVVPTFDYIYLHELKSCLKSMLLKCEHMLKMYFVTHRIGETLPFHQMKGD